ncbi:lipopolysaccharide biosynthesis protein [Streptomyces sp. NPDC020412]|uniref:lipopolysaccharide biosynthesis protein n=1 Tax=Streptomyces sp. NPDC020412 TaxID=3365073 RepID=UPI0037908A3D
MKPMKPIKPMKPTKSTKQSKEQPAGVTEPAVEEPAEAEPAVEEPAAEPPAAKEPRRTGRGRPGKWAARARARGRRLPPWWPLPALVAAGGLCGAGYGLLATPEYAATSYVVAVTGKDAQPGAALGFAQAYGRIATSDSTIAYARVAAGVPADELRSRVRTETSPDSPMIAITGTSDRRGEAADIANAVADAVFVSSNQVAKNTGVQLLSFSRAIPPAEPVSPSAPIGAGVGAAAGGLIGGLVLLVRPRGVRRTEGGPVGEGAVTVPVPAPAAELERV